MTRARPPYTPTPRIWNEFQMNARFGKGGNWYHNHRTELEAMGFPAFDEFLGGWDADAIEFWFDRRSGIAEVMVDDHHVVDDGIEDRLEALKNGQL